MRKIGIILIALVLISGCGSAKKHMVKRPRLTLETQLQDLADQISLSLTKEQSTKVAIIEFSDLQGQVTRLGRFIAEELTTRLFRSGSFEVIERQLLSKVLQEQQLTLTGILDAESAVKLGKLLGVQAIASGTITDLGESLKVNARLIFTQTGKVFAVAAVTIPKDNTVRALLQGTVDDVPGTSRPEAEVLSGPFRIAFISARRQGRAVVCQLQITNESEDDADFVIAYGRRYKTQIHDDSGSETNISVVKFANKAKHMKGLSQYESVKKKIIAGQSVSLELHFDKVPSAAKNITLLQILGARNTHVEFRDLRIDE